MPSASVELVAAILILWATTGLTVLHLGVIGWRQLTRRRAHPPPAPPAQGQGPTLTFVVSVYNDGLTVGPTLESLLRQSERPDRILVVNDGSTDDTARVLETFRDRGVDVMHLPANVGKPRALDAALRTVDTELVAITDADSIVDVDYAREVKASFADPELVAVGGAVESIPHTWVTAARQIEYMMTVNVDRDAESAMNALLVLPGVSSTYRTAVLRELGFQFDTIAEDFDITFRLQRARRKIAMNMRAKVYTSDPPTLRAYYRQLTRWYTDFWLVVKKHRQVLGKRVFGAVEVPMVLLNATAVSLAYFVLPAYFLWKAPWRLVEFFAAGFIADVALCALAWRLYRRNDVWWGLASRTPTRTLARAAFLVSMTRVLVGRPGLAWTKLERRSTSDFLARAPATRAVPAAMPPAEKAIWWCALALVLAGSVLLPLRGALVALLPLVAGVGLLVLRMMREALSRHQAAPAAVALLVGAQILYLFAAVVAVGLLPIALELRARVAVLAIASQLALGALSLPWRSAAHGALALAAQAAGAGATGLLLAGAAWPLALVLYAACLACLTGAVVWAGERATRPSAALVGGASGLCVAAAVAALAGVAAAGSMAVVTAGFAIAFLAKPPFKTG